LLLLPLSFPCTNISRAVIYEAETAYLARDCALKVRGA
jgi:hypothetical protein